MAKKKQNTGKQLFDSQDATPAMPEGFYSGDKPNPQLRGFVEEHSSPFDMETDNYDVPAFAEPITSTKATALYNMHTYWSKKPHDAIREYIRHFTKSGDVVLDPFCGSGGTALAALIEGRAAVAIDRSPAATFIAKNYCTPRRQSELDDAFTRLVQTVQKEIDWLYETKCDRCDGIAQTTSVICSQIFKCPRCLEKTTLYDCVEADAVTLKGKPKKVNVCPRCHKKGHIEIIRSQGEKHGFIPVLVNYRCLNGCSPAKSSRTHNDSSATKRAYFEKFDLGKLKEIDSKRIPHPYPVGFSMTEFSRYQRDALFYYGVKEAADLFTKRNLWALAAIMDAASAIDCDTLKFCFSAMCLFVSRMHQDNSGTGGNITKGTYYLPQVFKDMQVLDAFERKWNAITKGIEELNSLDANSDLSISTQDCRKLDVIPANSIDYIFTDPPYSHTVQYGELNFVWEAWLGFDTKWHHEEIIVNHERGRSAAEWAEMMRAAMAECFRVLKPGRWLTLCFHDEEGTWELVQDFMAEVGFVVDKTDSVLFIDTGQKSYNQLTADKARKRDLVLNFRKPKPGELRVTQIFIPANVDVSTFQELARQVIKDVLTAQPGATKDRIYDSLVSCMVRKGQMEAHDFDTLLRSVAEEVKQPVKEDLFHNKEPDLFGSHVQSRWYLKETADQVDHAEQAKEDAAAARLSKYIIECLKKAPELEGVHYSDLFEQYLPIHDKPRRLMADWLVEYFIKTASGTWRLPDKDEAPQLAKLREAGTLRRIKRFANALIEGVPVRDKDRPGSDVDLLDWLRQCRRAGLYEQGKAIYEKGGMNSANLTDEQQIEAEDDYRICARRGSTEDAKPKRKSRKKQDDDE